MALLQGGFVCTSGGIWPAGHIAACSCARLGSGGQELLLILVSLLPSGV